MLQHDKQNRILSSNHSDHPQPHSSLKPQPGKNTPKDYPLQLTREQMLDEARREVYDQHRKNRTLFERILQKNPHFSYQMHKRSARAQHEHVITRQHQQLLQEETYLIKQLAKIEAIKQLNTPQKDLFSFLRDVWGRDRPSAFQNAEDRVDELNKKLNFLKMSVKECSSMLSGDQFVASCNPITQSKEYCEMEQRWKSATEQIEKMKQVNSEQAKTYEQMIKNLEKKNQTLSKQNKELSSKLGFFDDKFKGLFSKISTLSHEIEAKDRKLYEMSYGFANIYESKEMLNETKPLFEIWIKNHSQATQKTILKNAPAKITERSLQETNNFLDNLKEHQLDDSFSFAHSSVISQISFESIEIDAIQEKQNSLCDDVFNDSTQSTNNLPQTSTKKIRNTKNKELLFSQAKNRSILFPQCGQPSNQIEQNVSKPLRFIRRK